MTDLVRNINPYYRRIFLGIVILVLVVFFAIIFHLINDLIGAIVIAGVISYVYRPGVEILDRVGVSRTLGILGLFVITAALLYLLAQFLVPALMKEVGSFIQSLKQVDFTHIYRQVTGWFSERIPGASNLFERDADRVSMVAERISNAVSGFLQQSMSLVAGAFNFLSLAILLPFLIFFILKDGPEFSKKWIRKVPNRFFEMTLSLAHRIDVQLGNYIRSILVESLIIWVITWPLLAILGVRFSLVLGLINGLLNMIPFFGPMVSYIPVALVILISYQPIGWGLFWAGIILLGTQVLDNVVLKPVLISRAVPVHPAIVLIAVLIGGRLGGAIGMFIAVPFYAVMQVIIVDLYEHLRKYRIL